MATAEQEKIYQEIEHYYTLADQLIKTLEGAQENFSEENFTIAEDMINCLENSCEKLSTVYLEYVKDADAKKAIMPVREALNDLSAKVQECRGKILMINS
jgi:uncharacterized protein YukE